MSRAEQIDVFIPVYNDQKFIGRAIQSCLNQQGVDVRVLVSDNFSTDQTFEILKQLESRDKRVIVSQNSNNLGMIENMKRVAELVDRPFYMFLCSDDYLIDKLAFSKALAVFREFKDVVSVYSNIDFVDGTGRRITTNVFRRRVVFDAEETFRKSLLTTRNEFGIPLLHKTAFASQYKFHGNFAYTNDLWHSYKVGSLGRCGHIPNSCIANTYDGGNMTRTLMNDAIREIQLLAKTERVELSNFEKIIQRLNHFRTVFMKWLFFRAYLPIRAYFSKQGMS